MNPRDNAARIRAHTMLDLAFDAMHYHDPAGGSATEQGKDASMDLAMACLNDVLRTCHPVLHHAFSVALLNPSDPNSHRWESTEIDSPDYGDQRAINRYRHAIAWSIYKLDAIFPQGIADVVVVSLEGLCKGSVDPLSHPFGKQQAKTSRFLKDNFQRQLARHVYYFAGRHDKSLSEARRHYANLVAIDVRSVARWDNWTLKEELASARKLGAARRLSQSNRGAPSEDEEDASAWRFLDDESFKRIYDAQIFKDRTAAP